MVVEEDQGELSVLTSVVGAIRISSKVGMEEEGDVSRRTSKFKYPARVESLISN